MKVHYFFSYLLLLLCGVPAFAQEGQEKDTLRVRSCNFYYYPKMFAVRLIYQERRLPLTLSPLSGDREASYQPNSNRSIGIGGALVGVSFSVSMALPQAFQRDPELYGSTTQRDLRLNAFAKRLGLQLDRQDYQGYYLNNVSQLDPDWQDGFPLRSDLRTRRLGVGISYLLRPDQFSYSVALNNIRRQRIGGGTFFFQVYAGRLWVQGDSLLLPRPFFAAETDAEKVEEVKVHHASLMSGYAHTFVLGKFYLMTALALGPELQRRTMSGESQLQIDQWTTEGRLQLQAAFGYDDHTYFWNIAYNSQRQQYELAGLGVSVNTNGVRLLVGRRFAEFGLLRKIRGTGLYKRLRPNDDPSADIDAR